MARTDQFRNQAAACEAHDDTLLSPETGETIGDVIARRFNRREMVRGTLGVVAAAGILFFASLALAPLLPTQFINAGSEKTLIVTVAPPAGASSAAVLAKTIQAETILRADPGVELVQTSIPAEGDTSSQVFQSALQGRAANSATMTVKLHPDADVIRPRPCIAIAYCPICKWCAIEHFNKPIRNFSLHRNVSLHWL
jgi:hypothetical protein